MLFDVIYDVINTVISVQLYDHNWLLSRYRNPEPDHKQATVAGRNCLLAGRNLGQDQSHIVWGGGWGCNIAYGWMSKYRNASLSQQKHIHISFQKINFVLAILHEM